MPLIKEQSFTIEDIYALPDGQRAELIDGVIYDMAPPSRTHQRIVTELSTIINQHINLQEKEYEIEAGVKLYWIADPSDRTVTVYDFVADTVGKYSFDDAVPVAICEGFTICIAASL